MEALLNFAFLAGLIFVMLRLGHVHAVEQMRGLQGGGAEGRRYPAKLRWVPPPTDVDPVCGKVVRTDAAKPSVHDGMVYYLCSRECREQFEAAPHLYVGPEAGPDPRRADHACG